MVKVRILADCPGRGIMKTLIGLIEALKNIRKARITYSMKTLKRDNTMKALIDEGYTKKH